MRGKYLFDLAHLCHISPREVDALRFLDLISLVLAIDSYWEAKKKSMETE